MALTLAERGKFADAKTIVERLHGLWEPAPHEADVILAARLLASIGHESREKQLAEDAEEEVRQRCGSAHEETSQNSCRLVLAIGWTTSAKPSRPTSDLWLARLEPNLPIKDGDPFDSTHRGS